MARYGNDYGRDSDDFDYLYYRADFRFEPRPDPFQRGSIGGGRSGAYDEGSAGWGWPEFGRYDPTNFGGGHQAGGAWDVEGSRLGSPSDFGGYRASSGWGGGTDPLRPSADRTLAADIMTDNPAAVTGDTTLAEVAKRMRDLDVGVMPVVDSEASYRLEGLITDRDIAVRAVADGEDITKARVAEFMTRDVETVSENDTVRDVFDVMKRERVRRVPVTDADGRLVGIIAQADLAVDYAALNLARENEVEEVLERISEPARPRWEWDRMPASGGYDRWHHAFGREQNSWYDDSYDRDFGDRLRHGWQTIRRGARNLLRGGYDRGWR